ncbi:MAG: glycosyltransferase family 87 protein [Acidobacteriaceae bacterium]
MATASALQAPASPLSRIARWPLVLPVLLVLSIAAPLWHIHVVDRAMPPRHNDLITRWLPMQAALRYGQDPYSPQATRQIQTAYYGRPLTPADDMEPQYFAYPAYLVVLMSPFARLPWTAACLGFVLIAPPLLFLSFWACMRSLNIPVTRGKTALAAFLALCSWPVMWGLRLQQPTLLIAVALFLGCYFLNCNRTVVSGMLLALSTLKPQMVLPLLLFLLLWACVQRSWTLIASFAATFALLLLSAEAMVPGWFGHWRASVRGYGPHTELPLQSIAGPLPGLILTAVLLGWCFLVLWNLRHAPAGSPQFALAIALALAIGVCCTLTKLAVIYDQILIVPGCLLLVFSKSEGYYPSLTRRVTLAMLIWGFLSIYIAILGETFFGPSDFWDGVPCRNLLLPVLVTVALALQAATAARKLHTSKTEAHIPVEATA